MINSNFSKSSKDATFTFAPSVQSDLFNYLKPHQQAVLKPYLRLIKRPYQEKLCISLMDYLEGHDLEPLNEPVLRQLQAHIIVACDLHPLAIPHSERDPHSGLELESHEMPHQVRHEDKQPKSIGTLIRQLFPSFSSISNR